MTTAKRYRQVDAPKHSSMYVANCAICGYEELTRPVYLQDTATGAVIAAGPQCAANELHGVTAKEVKANARALKKAAEAEERAAYIEWIYQACGVRKPTLALKLMGKRFLNQRDWAAQR